MPYNVPTFHQRLIKKFGTFRDLYQLYCFCSMQSELTIYSKPIDMYYLIRVRFQQKIEEISTMLLLSFTAVFVMQGGCEWLLYG